MSHRYGVAFPGQGSQRNGMGKDFLDRYPESRAIFDRADAVLGFNLAAICHQDDERIHLTEFTQPGILTTEIAMFEAIRAHYGLSPIAFAGHSLGEYTALVAAGAMPFEVAVQLVHLRGKLMQQAVAPGVGAMIAFTLSHSLPFDRIREVAQQYEVDVANENSPKQVVLSGEKSAMEAAGEAITAENSEIRATWLTTSAPFHSRHMAGIEPEFRAALENERGALDATKATVVTSNLLGDFHTGDTDALIDALTRQISSPVLWIDNMRALSARAEALLEIGPNRPLRGFFKALDLEASSIIDIRSARRALGADESAAPASA